MKILSEILELQSADTDRQCAGKRQIFAIVHCELSKENYRIMVNLSQIEIFCLELHYLMHIENDKMKWTRFESMISRNWHTATSRGLKYELPPEQ